MNKVKVTVSYIISATYEVVCKNDHPEEDELNKSFKEQTISPTDILNNANIKNMLPKNFTLDNVTVIKDD